MSETVMIARMPEAVLEVVSPEGTRTLVRVDRSPFLIGRGADTGNHLQLNDRRISRQCAALVFDGKVFRLEDRGQKRGLFVNGEKAPEGAPLRDGDAINFGLPDSYELVFRSDTASLPKLLDRMEHLTATESGAGGLRKLNLLLEATSLLHSHMPLETILANMVDTAIQLIDAEPRITARAGRRRRNEDSSRATEGRRDAYNRQRFANADGDPAGAGTEARDRNGRCKSRGSEFAGGA